MAEPNDYLEYRINQEEHHDLCMRQREEEKMEDLMWIDIESEWRSQHDPLTGDMWW